MRFGNAKIHQNLKRAKLFYIFLKLVSDLEMYYLCKDMDVELLAKMIRELIVDHDKVGLPGVGTFYAEVVPATFSDKGYTINPPYRRLSFHPSRSDDSLLTDFYAESNMVAPEAAKAYLNQFLHELKTVLKERKTIVLPGLGRLRATRENNFFFVADENLDIFPDGFAMEPVSLKTLQEPEAIDISESFAEIVKVAAKQQLAELQSEPQTEQQAEPQFEQKPEPKSESQPQPESQPESQPEQHAEPETPAQEPDVAIESKTKKSFRWWVLLLCLFVLAGVAVLAFLILVEVAPDLVDTILYTPEELRIINY